MLKFLMLLLLFAIPAQAVEVHYKISKPHGLLNFLFAVGGDSERETNLGEAFRRSRFHTAELRSKLQAFGKVRRALGSPVGKGGGIPGRSTGHDVKSFLVQQSIFAKNLDDLRERTYGILPVEEHNVLFKLLGALEPVYNELVWNPGLPELQARQRSLEALARKVKLNDMFDQAAHFYQANWPKEQHFTVGLYAVPMLKKFGNMTSSHSMGSIEEHGVFTGMGKNGARDTADDFATIFHELCHSLYGAQSTALMEELEKAFFSAKPPYGRNAYQWINEALATSLGNGWAYSLSFHGKDERLNWYAQPTIDSFARKIHPLVLRYLQEKKQFGPSFIGEAAEIFAKEFPDSATHWMNILERASVLYEQRVWDNKFIRAAFEKNFPEGKVSLSAPIAHPESIEAAKEEIGTLVVLLAKGEAQELPALAAHIPTLAQSEAQELGNRSIWHSWDSQGRAYLVIRANTRSELEEAISAMKNAGKLDPKSSTLKY